MLQSSRVEPAAVTSLSPLGLGCFRFSADQPTHKAYLQSCCICVST